VIKIIEKAALINASSRVFIPPCSQLAFGRQLSDQTLL
jgi:hypothetical protein